MGKVTRASGSVPERQDDATELEAMLSSASWHQRLEEARRQRARVLAERARLGLTPDLSSVPPAKPWDRRGPSAPATRRAPAVEQAEMQDALARIRRTKAEELPPLAPATVVPIPRRGKAMRPAQEAVPVPVVEPVIANPTPDAAAALQVAAPPEADTASYAVKGRRGISLWRIAAGFALGFLIGAVCLVVSDRLSTTAPEPATSAPGN